MIKPPIVREKPLRILVVDDSAYNRKSIGEMLTASSEVEVIGKAADGEEALRLCSVYKPDAITLDLEMPKMDGFTFLRILMSRTPTPVIVVSSYSQKENVFKALELGAFDFVAKPDRHTDAELAGIRDDLIQKVLLVRTLRPALLYGRRPFDSKSNLRIDSPRAETSAQPLRYVIAIASSTGGPSALIDVFSKLNERARTSVLVAQHMPEKFTRTFAERLDRRSAFRVSEAADLDAVSSGVALVCPGKKCMELTGTSLTDLRMRVVSPEPDDRYVPSADRLFTSVARVAGVRAVGVILTGMGDDGVQGAREIRAVGGTVLAESDETAVVYGMPGAAVRAGVVSHSLPLGAIAEYLAGLAV